MIPFIVYIHIYIYIIHAILLKVIIIENSCFSSYKSFYLFPLRFFLVVSATLLYVNQCPEMLISALEVSLDK